MFGARNIGLIDAGVRDYESQSMAHDQHVLDAADHLGGFAQHQFYEARIFAAFGSQFVGARTGFDFTQIDVAVLCFGDDFLTKHDDVAIYEFDRIALQRCYERGIERRSGLDFWNFLQSSEGE